MQSYSKILLYVMREGRKGWSTNHYLALIVDPVFTPSCLLLAPCPFTGPATHRSCKSTRKGNYKKHTSIIDYRISINQMYKHLFIIKTHAHRRISNTLLIIEVKFWESYNHNGPNPATPPSWKKSPLHLLQSKSPNSSKLKPTTLPYIHKIPASLDQMREIYI